MLSELMRLLIADDPTAVRSDVKSVMSGDAYSYEPGVMERIGGAVSRFFDRLFGKIRIPGLGSSFSGGAGSLIAWLLIGIAVGIVGLVIFRAIRSRVRRAPKDETPATVTTIDHARRARDWGSDAERWEAEGRWADAIQARYAELVRTLVDRGQLPDVAGRTTGELRSDLMETTPSAWGDFDRASEVFELAWYAEAPVSADDLRALRHAATQVIEARWVATDSGQIADDGRRAGVTV